jgi:hypothetical protein
MGVEIVMQFGGTHDWTNPAGALRGAPDRLLLLPVLLLPRTAGAITSPAPGYFDPPSSMRLGLQGYTILRLSG